MQPEDPVRQSTAHCSALDQTIRVLVKPLDWSHGRVPSTRDATEALTCLEYGVRCTGWLCPLFAVPEVPLDGLLPDAVESERTRKERTGGVDRPAD